MLYLIIITTTITILLLLFTINKIYKQKKLIKDLKSTIDDYCSDFRFGYISSKFTYSDKNKIESRLFFKEIEKYKNNKIKIELLYIDVIGDFLNISEYQMKEIKKEIIKTTKNKFISIIDETDKNIIFLEKEEDILLERKKKFDKLFDKEY